MSRPFRFRQFTIRQEKNTQKVGTDSMLLGAWVTANPQRILDIGTGTGILALMMAQRFPAAEITAIEPDLPSFEEASVNFKESVFAARIHANNCRLQAFETTVRFDLIITNPPYFDNAFLSADAGKNRARHTLELPDHELYAHSKQLLAPGGIMALVIPAERETQHLAVAEENGLFPQQILRSLTPGGNDKRSFIRLGETPTTPTLSSILVKNTNNRYSPEYIALTAAFYLKDLSAE